MLEASNLLSSANNVETPFIIVTIGDYTFGHCTKSEASRFSSTYQITYPDFMESLNITKINGTINTYVLTMIYAIAPGDDPNALEKVFSSVSKSRTLKLTYGDWNSPSYIYKEEEAIITKLTTKVDMNSSKIEYVINCTSSAIPLTSTAVSFPARYAKPSDEIKRIISNKSYGLTDIFKGMANVDPSNFIDGSDKSVQLEAKPQTSFMSYLNYLVSSMTRVGDNNANIKDSTYMWAIYDDVNNKYGGAYFKVVNVDPKSSSSNPTYDTYEVDIGYPTDRNVIDFTINNDDSWSLLYDYSSKIGIPKHTYTISNSGQIVKNAASPQVASQETFTPTEASKDWWTKMTQFPISATLVLKGLLRPAMLMSYVKINCYFYGQKHVSSGTYIITKQVDSISSSGYKTTLSLLRISEDE